MRSASGACFAKLASALKAAPLRSRGMPRGSTSRRKSSRTTPSAARSCAPSPTKSSRPASASSRPQTPSQNSGCGSAPSGALWSAGLRDMPSAVCTMRSSLESSQWYVDCSSPSAAPSSDRWSEAVTAAAAASWAAATEPSSSIQSRMSGAFASLVGFRASSM